MIITIGAAFGLLVAALIRAFLDGLEDDASSAFMLAFMSMFAFTIAIALALETP